MNTPEPRANRKSPAPFVSKRGRPTQAQVLAIDGVIVATARTMFLEHGYANTSMEAVASATGVSKGTLYARYPTKPDLFEAIVEDRMRVWAETLDTVPDGVVSDITVHLERSGTRFLDSMRDPEVRAFDRLIQAEAVRFPELARRFYEQGYASVVAGLVSAITQAAAAQHGPVQDALGVAHSFYSGLLGWFRNESVVRDVTPEACRAQATRFAALLTGGRTAW